MENNKTETVNIVKTYIVTVEHNRKLELLKPLMGLNKSEIVRLAIDELFDKHIPSNSR